MASHSCLTALLPLACLLCLHSGRAQVLSRSELEIYSGASHIIDFSKEELVRKYPELSRLHFSDGQDALPELLLRTGRRIEEMFSDFPNTASEEQVRQDFVGLDKKYTAGRSRTFDYLFIARSGGAALGWDEVRTDSKGEPVAQSSTPGTGFLTSGYAGLAYFFHPLQQPGSRFRYLGREPGKPGAHVVAFAQKPESGECLGSFVYEGTTALLMFQGVAWLAPGTHQIERMRVSLLAPRPDVGLYRQDTEIWFAEVEFPGVARTLWLPRQVVVSIDCKGRTFRNRHRYSGYRLFTVETHERILKPSAPPGPGS